MKATSLFCLATLSLGLTSVASAEPFTNLPLVKLSQFQQGSTLLITLNDDYIPLKDRKDSKRTSFLDSYGMQVPGADSPRAAAQRMNDALECSVTQGVAGADAIALPRGTQVAVTNVLYHGDLATVKTWDPTPMGVIIQTTGNLFDISCHSFRSGWVPTADGQRLTMIGIRDFTLEDLANAFQFSLTEQKQLPNSVIALSSVEKAAPVVAAPRAVTPVVPEPVRKRSFFKRLFGRK